MNLTVLFTLNFRKHKAIERKRSLFDTSWVAVILERRNKTTFKGKEILCEIMVEDT